MPDPSSVVVAAPAKVNLYLHVVGRRADGYHELDSLVAFASPHDLVAARAAGGLTFEAEGPFAGRLRESLGGAEDLTLRAARALASWAKAAPGAALRLRKTLPVASGIGGGSADAAAALIALRTLWRLDPPPDALAALALALGADVPVCLAGRARFVGGVGERLEDAPALPPLGIVLVNPGVALATAEVFRGLAGRCGPAARPVWRAGDAASLLDALRGCRNDLTASAIALAPAVGAALAALRALPEARLVRMSGSGATCFALCDDEAAAHAAARRLAAAHGGWWIAPGRLIAGRDELNAR